MSTPLLLSMILINLALLFYSVGVWAERFSKYLKKWHLWCFWTGLMFDFSGTLAMHYISDKPFNFFDAHTLTGQLALWLMLAHAIWATRVVKSSNDELKKKFHKYSLLVWIIWLIPYVGGAFLGILPQ